MKECLDYIKQTGEEIRQLNDEIKREKDENKRLRDEIRKLEKKIAKYDAELVSIRRLANRWYDEYEELSTKYDNLEAKHDFVNHVFATVLPKTSEEAEKDFDGGKFFSEIINEFKRSRW